MKSPIRRISRLEKARMMGHDPDSFHAAQLREGEFMRMVASTADAIVKNLPKRQGLVRILELGAGSGILTEEVISRLSGCDGRFSITVTEPDGRMISFCRDMLAKNAKIENSGIALSFCQMRAEDIGRLRGQRYDAIMSSEVFHHLPYDRKLRISKQIIRKLKKWGFMVLGDQFTADAYSYEKNGKLVDDRRIIAPIVAAHVAEFYNRLWRGRLPGSFRQALEQQREGVVECKTSLPHLIAILDKAGWKVTNKKIFCRHISSEGGYAVLMLEPKVRVANARAAS